LDRTAFGRQLKTLRKLRGLTQAQLAEEVLVSTISVSNWERAADRNGKAAAPNRENVLALVRYFQPQLTPDEAQAWTQQVGHPLTAIDLAAIFSPADQPIPRQAPPLPAIHIDRTELQQKALEDLRTHRAVALVGLGGNGKSILAAWLARRQAPFCPDGLLWSSEGTTDDRLVMLARSFGVSLTGTTTAERAGELRSLLADKSYLLVLDDLTGSDDLSHLQVIGESGYLIVTTRDNNVAARMLLPAVKVPGMSADEGNALLSAWLKRPVSVPLLVERLAGSPLALHLSAAQLRWQAFTLDELLQADDLAVFAIDEPQRRHDSLVRCLDDTYRHLSANNQPRLLQLGVFSGQFDTEMAAAMWGTTTVEAGRTIRHLQRWHLVERTSDGYRLHDLVRDYARQKLAAVPVLARQTHLRHLAYFVRNYLYHPGVLGDRATTAPPLDAVWPEIVAAFRWAIDEEPRLVAGATLLAHTERAALLESAGPSLITAIQAHAATVEDGTARALLYEMVADLYLHLEDREAGRQAFEAAAKRWAAADEWLQCSRVQVRLAGISLVMQDWEKATGWMQQAQASLSLGLPLIADQPDVAYWLFYWFDTVYFTLAKWERLPEDDVKHLLVLSKQAEEPVLMARAYSAYVYWCTAPARIAEPEIRRRGINLAVSAFWLWRQSGRRVQAQTIADGGDLWFHGRYSRRAAYRYARRRVATTPHISKLEARMDRHPAVKWWLLAGTQQRVEWLAVMWPRYVQDQNIYPLGKEWVEQIINIGIAGSDRRRLVRVSRPPAGHILEQTQWLILNGFLAWPPCGAQARRLPDEIIAKLNEVLGM
jgi:DNA-binding XRE family transcriptional regulator